MANVADLLGRDYGYSPELLADEETKAGGLDELMRKILASRYGTADADPELSALAPSQRAAIDRYANLALAAKDQGPLGYPGAMGLMAITELLKAAQPLQSAASSAWRTVSGAPQAENFFGGRDVSAPNVGNLLAAHYGYIRGLKERK